MTSQVTADFNSYISSLTSTFSAPVECKYYSEQEFNARFQDRCNNLYNLSLFHVNIRSLNANHLKLQQLFLTLKCNFDIIVLSEIWSFNVTMYYNLFPEYNFYYVLPNNSCIGGIGAYIHSSFTVTESNDLISNLSNTNSVHEYLLLELNRGDYRCILSNFYRHPNQPIESFTNFLESIFQTSLFLGNQVDYLVVGDLNIDLLKYDKNSDICNFIDMMISYNFQPLTILPTRISKTSATLLDHVFYKCNTKCKNLDYSDVYNGVLITDIADHLANFLILPSLKTQFKTNDRPLVRLLTPINKMKFVNELTKVDLERCVCTINDVDLAYEKFISVLLDVYEKCFPLTRMSRKKCKDKKWVTPAIKKSSEIKNRLYKDWIISKNPQNREKYKSYVKLYNKILKKAQDDYFTTAFNNKLNSSKKIWKEINSLCSFSAHCSSSRNTLDKLVVNGNTISDPVCMANHLNIYFCGVGANLASQLPAMSLSSDFVDFLPPSISNSFVCDPISHKEICNALDKFSAKSSVGLEVFKAKIILEVAFSLVPALCYIFNLSLTSGIFPSALKIAKVIPIYKKGSHSELGNYRPISLLKIFSKVFEHIVAARVSSFFVKYNLFYDYQFGFRSKHSTNLALLNTVDDILSSLDKNNYVAGIFLDLSKAFDSIPHTILLKKLSHYGIRGQMLNWFKSYLTNRSQYTCVNGYNSTCMNIEYGVPQGSVLGPLLFLIFINDIGFLTNLNYKPKLFADDTNIFVNSPTLPDLQMKCQNSIDIISKWIVANRLTINLDKTCYMIFSPSQNSIGHPDLDLYLTNCKIKKVTSTKYLGITIDENLNWKEHINNLCLELRKFIGIFYKLSFKLPPPVLRTLYFALVYSRIFYAVAVYANTYLTYLHDLIVLNNRILRILQHMPRSTSIVNLYGAYKTLPINKLFNFQILLHAFKLLNCSELLPNVFHHESLTNSDYHSHNTRNKHGFHITSFSTTAGSKTSIKLCAKFWNLLPFQFRDMRNMNSFSRDVKEFLLFNDF